MNEILKTHLIAACVVGGFVGIFVLPKAYAFWLVMAWIVFAVYVIAYAMVHLWLTGD